MGLPDPLSEPHPLGGLAELGFDQRGQPLDLLALVPIGDDGEHRRVIAAGDEFDLLAIAQGLELRDELGVVLQEPFEQGPRVVQGDADAGMAREDLEKRQVGAGVGLLDDPVPVPEGLVVVHPQGEVDGRLIGEEHGESLWSRSAG
ncbi:hypothetical protein D3C86_1183900 [compost metagenome]